MSTLASRRRGAIAALVAGVLAVGAVILTSDDMGKYEVEAVFDTANGLVKTGEVRVGGFRIGTITKVDLEDDGYPHVRMKLEKSYRLRQGATAEIRMTSQAGQLNRYVALTNGKGRPLPDGATLGLARTDQPVELDEFLEALNPKTRREVRDLLRNALRAFDGRENDIHDALRQSGRSLQEAAALLGDVTADGEALRTIVARAQDGARAVAADPAALDGAVTNLAAALEATAGRNREVAESLRLLPATVRPARVALQRFDEAIPAFQQLTDATQRVLGPLGPFARQLRATMEGTAPAAFDSTYDLIRSFPKSGPRILALLRGTIPSLDEAGPVLKQLNPILDQLRARAPEALGWVPLFGDVAANYDLVGHGARVMAALTDVPRRIVAGDSCLPGWLPRPFDRPPGALECDTWKDFADSFIGGGQTVDDVMTPEERRVRDGGLG